MSFLRYRALLERKDLEYFCGRFAHFVGVRIPVDYLEQGEVIAAYDVRGEMVGGYAVICGPNFRTLTFIPSDIKENSPFLQKTDLCHYVEANGVWLSPSVRSPLESMRFWLRVRTAILRAKRQYLIIMYNRRVRHLKRFYSYLCPVTIYEGPAVSPGAQVGAHAEIFVGYVDRKNLHLSSVRYVPEMVKRVNGAARRVRPRQIRGAQSVPLSSQPTSMADELL